MMPLCREALGLEIPTSDNAIRNQPFPAQKADGWIRALAQAFLVSTAGTRDQCLRRLTGTSGNLPSRITSAIAYTLSSDVLAPAGRRPILQSSVLQLPRASSRIQEETVGLPDVLESDLRPALQLAKDTRRCEKL